MGQPLFRLADALVCLHFAPQVERTSVRPVASRAFVVGAPLSHTMHLTDLTPVGCYSCNARSAAQALRWSPERDASVNKCYALAV